MTERRPLTPEEWDRAIGRDTDPVTFEDREPATPTPAPAPASKPQSVLDRFIAWGEREAAGMTPEQRRKATRDGAIITASAATVAAVGALWGVGKAAGKVAKGVGGWERSLTKAMRESTKGRRR